MRTFLDVRENAPRVIVCWIAHGGRFRKRCYAESSHILRRERGGGHRPRCYIQRWPPVSLETFCAVLVTDSTELEVFVFCSFLTKLVP